MNGRKYERKNSMRVKNVEISPYPIRQTKETKSTVNNRWNNCASRTNNNKLLQLKKMVKSVSFEHILELLSRSRMSATSPIKGGNGSTQKDTHLPPIKLNILDTIFLNGGGLGEGNIGEMTKWVYTDVNGYLRAKQPSKFEVIKSFTLYSLSKTELKKNKIKIEQLLHTQYGATRNKGANNRLNSSGNVYLKYLIYIIYIGTKGDA